MNEKLFQLSPAGVTEYPSGRPPVQQDLQNLLEQHLEAFLGVRFIATGQSTAKRLDRRIDTLGLDENNRPVVIAYKRELSADVTTQGLFHLKWLATRRGKAQFRALVKDKLGAVGTRSIVWSRPRVICIAADFNKHDTYPEQGFTDNEIELVRYRMYGTEHLTIEHIAPTPVTVTFVERDCWNELMDTDLSMLEELYEGDELEYPDDVLPTEDEQIAIMKAESANTATNNLYRCSSEIQDYMRELRVRTLPGLGEDVQMKTLKHYFAFKRLQNFVCVVPDHSKNLLRLYLNLDPATVVLEKNFSRDACASKHVGTGDLEITIRNEADLQRAAPLLLRSYAQS